MFDITKFDLTKKKIIIIIPVTFFVLMVLIYNLLYAPLINKKNTIISDCNFIETTLCNARNLIRSASDIDITKILIKEKDLSTAMAELLELGKNKQISFISKTVRPIITSEISGCKILPIDLNIESGYNEFGLFLGGLSDLKNSIARVTEFNIISKDNDTSKIIVKLNVDLYFLSEEYFKSAYKEVLIASNKKNVKSVEWGRSPFNSKSVFSGAVKLLELNGILWSENDPKVIINNRLLSVGDKIQDAIVVKILKNSVILNKTGKELLLEL